MTRLSRLTGYAAVAIMFAMADCHVNARDKTEGFPPGYTATGPNGYVYVAPSYQPAVPYSPYGGFYTSGYLPPPVGFGSPYYSGYNDPNYGLYGPGVREFLRYGGADFYGW